MTHQLKAFAFSWQIAGGEERQAGQILKSKQTRAQPIVQIMAGVGNIVGQGRHLRLQTSLAGQVNRAFSAEVSEETLLSLSHLGLTLLGLTLLGLP